MAFDWLRARQTKFAAYAGSYTLVVLAVLVAVNFLANRYDKSYDSTSNKQFSLSDQTAKIVRALKSDTQLTYFGSQQEFQSARDVLDRYSALSPKVHAVYLDPERKPQQAKAAGYRSDSQVIVDNGARRESAKSLSEEEVTGAILRSTKSAERNVCVLSAAGEHSIDDSDSSGYSLFKQILERDNYKVRTETLKPAASAEPGKTLAIGQTPEPTSVSVPKDCTILVVAGPKSDYPTPIVNALKSYVESGGRALFLLDTPLRLGQSEPSAENADLLKLLADWGVTANKDLVLDLSGLGRIFNLGPEVPFIVQYESHPITQPLTRVPTAYPLTRSFETKSTDKTSISKLIETGDDSLATDTIGPRGAVDPKKGKKGPLTLAVAGTYSSTPQGRFVVIGSSLVAENGLLGSRGLDNRDLLANAANWLSSDEELISIRPKPPEERPLNLTAGRLQSAFWLSVVAFPLGVVALGLVTWWRRR